MSKLSRIRCTDCGPRRPRVSGVAVLVICVMCVVAPAREPSPTLEYQVKASFLSRFLSYVEWPHGVFTEPSDSLIVAVIGDDRFGPALDSLVSENPLKRPIKVAREVSVENIGYCHLLYFVDSKDTSKVTEFLQAEHKGVLTIGESTDFARAGGIINFVLINGKLRFEINASSARRADLAINSELLKLATKVYHDNDSTD